jgi:hypothetical protein
MPSEARSAHCHGVAGGMAGRCLVSHRTEVEQNPQSPSNTKVAAAVFVRSMAPMLRRRRRRKSREIVGIWLHVLHAADGNSVIFTRVPPVAHDYCVWRDFLQHGARRRKDLPKVVSDM